MTMTTDTTTLGDKLQNVLPELKLSSAYYEPMEHIGELLKSEALVKSVRSSLCWYLDNQYVRSVRDVFFACFNSDTTMHRDFNEFRAAMEAGAFADYMTNQQGHEVSNGVSVLRCLASVRVDWYDQLNTEEAMPTMEELLLAEKPQRLSPMSAAKLRTLANAIADDESDEIKEAVYNQMVHRENVRAQMTHERRHEMIASLVKIEYSALLTDVGSDNNDRFWHLPLPMQKRLVENTVQIVDRTLEQLAKSRLDVLEYATCVTEGVRARKAIKAVLAQPRFANVAE